MSISDGSLFLIMRRTCEKHSKSLLFYYNFIKEALFSVREAMKKRGIILTSLVCLTAAFGLASCNDGGGGDPAIYNITYEENDNYRVIDFDSQGQEGSNILFDVESTSVFYEIGEVTYNGTPMLSVSRLRSKSNLGFRYG